MRTKQGPRRQSFGPLLHKNLENFRNTHSQPHPQTYGKELQGACPGVYIAQKPPDPLSL